MVISSNSPVSSIPAVSHKGSIAFLLPKSGGVSDRITVPFYSELFYNIEKSCSNAGYSLIYASLDSAEDLGYIQQQTSNLRGIIFVSNVREECIQKALNEHIPCVLLNSYSPLLPSILSDNYSGARKATEYLLQNGHTSIAVLSGIVSYTTSQERLNGVLSVMREHNLSLPDAFYMRSTTGKLTVVLMQCTNCFKAAIVFQRQFFVLMTALLTALFRLLSNLVFPFQMTSVLLDMIIPIMPVTAFQSFLP